MYSSFAKYHPLVNFLFFSLVLLCTMFIMHPICLLISLISSFTYSIVLKGKKAIRDNLLYMLPMLLLAALVNPAFNHEGTTIIMYFKNGNPLTLESIIYGFAAATLMVSVICWFTCYNVIMTTDKFVYLFGTIIPSLSLVLSMTLRFVPRFKEQMKVISNAQKCIGRDISNGSLFNRLKNGIKIISIMITWSLENAVETADSMKCRGYGLPGRTAYSIYTLDKRDKKALLFISLIGLYVIIGAFLGKFYWRYFPNMKGVLITPLSSSVFIAYFILCMIPVYIEKMEDRRWRLSQSKI